MKDLDDYSPLTRNNLIKMAVKYPAETRVNIHTIDYYRKLESDGWVRFVTHRDVILTEEGLDKICEE